ncbi:hypothetical protein P389DRAFT_3477 [Cystobasidium minutum MCA 4210]|uniref:uncharacterized protein n=1 Tax=Cystobasidium minutum MCA 4210 TaxID=1397322 RepID=UPI0034CF0D16|eukprot:jgi/Rhomi1/3477/CE3476_713
MDAITVGVMQGLSPKAAALVAEIKENVKLAQTLGACGFAVCLWDTLAYLHIEYRVVWLLQPPQKAEWSFMKASYLFTRYITLVTGILYFIGFFATFSASSCSNIVKAFPAVGTLPLLGCTLMLTARAYKLWDSNKLLLGAMLLLATAQIIGQITVAVLQTVPVPIGNGVKTCVPTTKGTIFVLYWILPAVAHFFLALFTFIKAWRLTSEDSSPSIASRIWSTVFSRYGLIFPICIVLVEFTQIIFYLVADEMQRAILSPLSGFLITVLACQMVLIYRLTSKSGMAGFSSSTGNFHSNPLHSKGSQSASLPTFGRLGGVQAFVTSHQAIDDEKGSYTPTAVLPSGVNAPHRASVINIVPQLSRSAPFSTSTVRKAGNDDLSDSESLHEEQAKASPDAKRGGSAL